MKTAVFAICALYALIIVVFGITTATASGMDAMSRGMSFGFLILGAAITALFAVPALILAAKDKALPWALGLVLVPAVLMIVTGGI